MRRPLRTSLLLTGLWLAPVGCAERASALPGEQAVGETGASAPAPEPGPDLPDPGGTGAGHGDGDGDGDGDDAGHGDSDGSTFLGEDEGWGGSGCGGYCEFWADRPCDDGEKCQAIRSTPGSGVWDANVCVPAGADGVGESCCLAGVGDCWVEGPTGTDSCDETSICLNVAQDTLLGTCVEYCAGPQSDPSCPQSEGICHQLNGGVINLCLDPCDPLQDGECADGQLCAATPLPGDGFEGFVCFIPGAEELGGHADPCECTSCCQPGLTCTASALVGADCASDFCCTDLCDLNDPEFACEGSDQVCVPLFEDTAPVYAHLGRCEVPG